MKSKIFLSEFVDRLQGKGTYFFDRQQVQNILHKSKASFDLALYRLVKKNRIARVRANFYIIIPLEYSILSSLPASWFIDPFMQFMETNYYVGLLSAAELFGATHQQVMTFQVMTDRIMRPIRIGQVKIEFHYQKHIPQEFIDSIKTETGYMKVSQPEVTACDVMKYMNSSGYIHHVATVLSELQDKISLSRLVDYINIYSVGVVHIQRLGYLLEYLDLGINTTPLQQWLSNKRLDYRPLVCGSHMPYFEKNKRWHLLINEKIETDL